MAKQKNVFEEDRINLLDALMELQYLSQVMDWITKQAVDIGRKTLEKHKEAKTEAVEKAAAFLPGAFGVGSSLTVNNLFEKPGTYFAHGSRMATDNRLLDLIDELGGRLQAQCLSMAYEVMERFFKRVGGKLYFQKRGQFILHKKKDFHRKCPRWNTGTDRGTPQYYAAYAEWLCNHNSDELVSDLRDDIPAFQKVAKDNWLGIDLFVFHRAVSFSRHTTVHRGGVPSAERFRRLGKEKQGYVKNFMRKSALTGNGTILPPSEAVVQAIERLATLAHVLYRSASDACDMEV
jgi:hypothetical protein